MPLKINLKHLAYLSRADKCDKQGFLFKRGAFVNTDFKKRWFVLTGNLLFYFKNSTIATPTGAIVVEDCRVSRRSRDQQEPFYYCFSIFYDGEDSREYQLAATTKQDYDAWVEAIESASFRLRKQRLDRLQLKMFREEFCRGTYEFSGDADDDDADGAGGRAGRGAGFGARGRPTARGRLSTDVRVLAACAEEGTGFYDPSRPDDDDGDGEAAAEAAGLSVLDYGNDYDIQESSDEETAVQTAAQLEALSLAAASADDGSDDEESDLEEADFMIVTLPDGSTSTRYVSKRGTLDSVSSALGDASGYDDADAGGSGAGPAAGTAAGPAADHTGGDGADAPPSARLLVSDSKAGAAVSLGLTPLEVPPVEVDEGEGGAGGGGGGGGGPVAPPRKHIFDGDPNELLAVIAAEPAAPE